MSKKLSFVLSMFSLYLVRLKLKSKVGKKIHLITYLKVKKIQQKNEKSSKVDGNRLR